jgi:hypothetical protein
MARKKGDKALTQEQCYEAARLKFAGETPANIAAATGVSVGTLCKAKHHPIIGPRLVELAKRNRERLDRMYDKSLAEMERDLRAGKDETRAKARDQVLKYIESGEEKTSKQEAPTSGDFTLEQLLIAWRRTTTTT